MLLFRLGNASFPLFDGTGAMLHGGRWNSVGNSAIYCAESLAVCQLEMLVHIGRTLPPKNHAYIEISVPDDITVKRLSLHDLPTGWDNPRSHDISRDVGDAWIRKRETAILIVPSVAAPNDRVIVINPRHPDFVRMSASAPRPMVWDPRLFP